MFHRFIFIALSFCLGFCKLSGQKGVEIGTWLGVSNYFGDLNNLYRLNEPGLAGGLIARYNLNNRVSPQILLNYSRLRAHDSKSSNLFDRRRNLSFFSDVIELSPSISFNFFPFIHGKAENSITPHLITGFSFFYFNPKAEYLGQAYNLRSLGTEGQSSNQEYGAISAAWLVGLGLKIDLNYHYSLNIDFNARLAFTDYLDDVSTSYPNLANLQSTRGPIAVALSDPSIPGSKGEKIGTQGFQRGDSKDKDMFTTLGVGLLYYFGRLDCPKISNPY